jgi:hypothetical protein
MYIKFWTGSLKGRGHVGDPSINGRIIIKLMLEIQRAVAAQSV